jgi:hypothetical protein
MRTLPLISELEAVVATGSNARHTEMLRRVTDLFVAGASRFTAEQIGVFDDVMVRLLPTLDGSACAELAQRLAPIANAPASVLHLLAFDNHVEVATPVLRHSERLETSALVANAKTKSQQHLLAIAQRGALNEAVTDVLIERGDAEVIRAVMNTDGSRFSQAGIRMLIERAAGDDGLAARIDLHRNGHLLGAGVPGADGPAANKGFGDQSSVGSAQESSAGGSAARAALPCPASVHAAALSPTRAGDLGELQLYQYACTGNFKETVLALSRRCDTPHDVVERALLDPSAEMILILARVAELSAATTKAILMLGTDEHGMSATDLDHALSSFERLQPNTARRVLNFFRTRLKKPAMSPGVAASG